LTDTERQEFETEADKYRRGDVWQRRDLRESHENTDHMDLGPTGSGCPCCGR
jgi:hypothetical protein